MQAVAAYPRRKPAWPLLVTLVIHLLLAWRWRVAHPPAPDLRAERVIDREVRKGKSGVPEVADTPMGRYGQALEGAYKDSSRTLSSESYTAPDGQVIYRFRHGGKVWCRTSGSVRPQTGGAVGGGATQFDTGGGGAAGLIRCPGHGDWKRD